MFHPVKQGAHHKGHKINQLKGFEGGVINKALFVALRWRRISFLSEMIPVYQLILTNVIPSHTDTEQYHIFIFCNFRRPLSKE